MKSSLATAKSRVPSRANEDDEDEDQVAPATAGRGGMPAGFPGMGGGGMPDLASMMQNPAIMQMYVTSPSRSERLRYATRLPGMIEY